MLNNIKNIINQRNELNKFGHILKPDYTTDILDNDIIESDTNQDLPQETITMPHVKIDKSMDLTINLDFMNEDDDYLTEMPANYELLPWSKIDKDIEHIISRHTASGRIRARFIDSTGVHGIKARFRLNGKEFNNVKERIFVKLTSNGKFNRYEQDIINYILQTEPRDLFPTDMSTDDIIRAIREAYNTSVKNGSKQIPNTDEYNPYNRMGTRRCYEGTYKSKYHGIMTIQFWVNLDYDIIETAYPVNYTK